MILIVAAWAFSAFIYFKVAFEAAFSSGISMIAALLLAILLGIEVFAASGVYATRLLPYNWTPGAVPARLSTLLGKTLMPALGITVLYVLVARLVIFGFSEDLSRRLDVFRGYRRWELEEDFVAFVLMTAAPVLAHYVLCIAGTYMNANRRQEL